MGKKYDQKGYIKLYRAMQESDIADKPPHFREVWLWLLMNAAPFDCTRKGRKLKRGQLNVSYAEIMNGLSWKIGLARQKYKKHHIDRVFRYLRTDDMIATTKTTGRVLVTILNYDKYQGCSISERDNTDDNTDDTDHLHLLYKRIKEFIYSEKIDLPDKFPLEAFCKWELARKEKHGSLSNRARKTAFTQLKNALQRKELLKADGYRSMADFLDHAAENKWQGFAWLKKHLNQIEDRLKQRENNYQKKIDDTATGQPKTVTKEDMIRELEED